MQILTVLKGKTETNTKIVRDFNTPFSSTDRSYRQKVSKERKSLNYTLDYMDFFDIYRAFHPKIVEYTLLSSPHGSFSRMDHMPSHKVSYVKFQKIEFISSIFSDNKAMKLELNYKKKCKRQTYGG